MYSAAAERFRRSDWKVKAQEAAVRLGGAPGEIPLEAGAPPSDEFSLNAASGFSPEPGIAIRTESRSTRIVRGGHQRDPASSRKLREHDSLFRAGKKGRRRGRRGGTEPAQEQQREGSSRCSRSAFYGSAYATPRIAACRLRRIGRADSSSNDAQPGNSQLAGRRPIGEPGGTSVKGRYGDPGLSSRISLLEMQFRRLMTCPPAKLEEADRAPAGPGVLS